MQRYNFDVDVIECEWGAGADLELLKQKLQADRSHSVKAVCVVHNETSTGVTNDIGAVRRILGKQTIFSHHHLSSFVFRLSSFAFHLSSFIFRFTHTTELSMMDTKCSQDV